VTVQSSAYYDSNIFGAATGAIDSMVYSIAPRLAFNASADPQTFVSASYQPRLDYFDNRPTEKWLLSHEAALRIAHAFTDITNVDLADAFDVEKNPQSLLPGIVLNTDQSYTRNEFDGRLTTALGPKTGAVFKISQHLLQLRRRRARPEPRPDRAFARSGVELQVGARDRRRGRVSLSGH